MLAVALDQGPGHRGRQHGEEGDAEGQHAQAAVHGLAHPQPGEEGRQCERKAGQRRGHAGIAREGAHRAGLSAGLVDAVAEGVEPMGRQHGGDLPGLTPAQRQQAQPAGQREPAAAPHRAGQAQAGQQVAAQEGAGQVRGRATGHRQPIAPGRQAQRADVDKRGAGEEHEQAAVGGRDQGRPGTEGGVLRHLAQAAPQRPGRQRLRVALRHGFRQPAPDEGQRQRAGEGHQAQRRAPACGCRHQATQAGRQDGDQPQTGQAARHHVRALAGFVQITHHRPCAHHRGGQPQPLRRPPGHQPADAGCQRRADAGQGVQAEAPQQHRAPAVPVGQGPGHQLRQAKGQQQGRHGELHRRHGRAQFTRQQRQGGQVQVGGDGLQAQQQGQGPGDKSRAQGGPAE